MADRVIHARAAFMSYTSEGPYALVVSGRVFTADPRWRPGDDDQPIPVVVIPLADYERLAALCQCRPPRAGQDGHTCPRCEDAGALTSERAEARRQLATSRESHQWEMQARAACLTEIDALKRQLGEAVEVQEDLAGKLFDAVRERDALLDMARDISVYAATSARHGSERSMRDVLTMTANRARSFLLPKSAHGAGEAK